MCPYHGRGDCWRQTYAWAFNDAYDDDDGGLVAVKSPQKPPVHQGLLGEFLLFSFFCLLVCFAFIRRTMS
jgi:hypothetical protein